MCPFYFFTVLFWEIIYFCLISETTAIGNLLQLERSGADEKSTYIFTADDITVSNDGEKTIYTVETADIEAFKGNRTLSLFYPGDKTAIVLIKIKLPNLIQFIYLVRTRY